MNWPLRGSIASGSVGFIGVIKFVFGIPGHIEDASTWYTWANAIPERIVLYASCALLFAALILGTHSRWRPLLARLVRVLRHDPALGRRLNDLERAEACIPEIKRIRPKVARFAGPDGVVRLVAHVTVVGNEPLIELMSELEYLASRLGELEIGSPELLLSSEKRSEVFQARLQHWNWFLRRLEELLSRGDIEGARHLVPPPAQFTDDQ